MKHESRPLRDDRTLPMAPKDLFTGFLTGWDWKEIAPQDVLDLVVAIGARGWIGSIRIGRRT